MWNRKRRYYNQTLRFILSEHTSSMVYVCTAMQSLTQTQSIHLLPQVFLTYFLIPVWSHKTSLTLRVCVLSRNYRWLISDCGGDCSRRNDHQSTAWIPLGETETPESGADETCQQVRKKKKNRWVYYGRIWTTGSNEEKSIKIVEAGCDFRCQKKTFCSGCAFSQNYVHKCFSW